MTLSIQDLAVAMLKCEQTKGQTVYQHGASVKNYFDELRDSFDKKIPSWLNEYRDQILDNLHSEDIVSQYTLYHDCGKTQCKVVDDNSNIHFPNHAEISKKLFLEAGGSPIAANLIGWDMEIHEGSSESIKHHLENNWSVKDACTLLLASLAEIHSNALLFGGQNSLSFKVKFKQIERRGKQICKYLFPY